MPSFERESNRIVIAGASSLLGVELKSLLEESKFAGWDLRLVDEELAAGDVDGSGWGTGGDSAGGRRQFREGAFHFFSRAHMILRWRIWRWPARAGR